MDKWEGGWMRSHGWMVGYMDREKGGIGMDWDATGYERWMLGNVGLGST